MACCKSIPSIFTAAVVAAGANRTRVTIPADCKAFILRPRTGIGITIALDASPGDAFFSLGASETYSEESLKLERDLDLWIGAAGDVTVEVWTWAG